MPVLSPIIKARCATIDDCVNPVLRAVGDFELARVFETKTLDRLIPRRIENLAWLFGRLIHAPNTGVCKIRKPRSVHNPVVIFGTTKSDIN